MSDLGIGARVKALRAERKLSLQAVSDRAGMTKSWLWEIEQGRQTNPTINSAVALSRALGVSLDYLTGLSASMPDLHPEALRIAIEVDALLRGKSISDALGAIAALPTGKTEDVCEGQEQAYRAVEALPFNRHVSVSEIRAWSDPHPITITSPPSVE